MIAMLWAKIQVYLVIAAVAGVALLAVFYAGRFYERAEINAGALDQVVESQRKISKRMIDDGKERNRQVAAINRKLRASERRYEEIASTNQAVRDWENFIMPPDSIWFYWVRGESAGSRKRRGLSSILRWPNSGDRARGPALAEVRNKHFGGMCRRLRILLIKDNIKKRQMLKFASDRLQGDPQ